MQPFRTTGRRVPLPTARYEAADAWKDADQKQLLQFLKAPSGTNFLHTPHAYGITAGRSLLLFD